MDLDAVPATPSEFVPLLELAEANDMRVHPFPPRSFLWTSDPDGWSWGTDSWSMYLRPRLGAEGVTWLIEYTDDNNHHAWLDLPTALMVTRGESLDLPD